MHGATGCPNSNPIRSGDDWLKAELPRIITWATTHAGTIFITWDEGSSTGKMPFLAVGPGVKANYTGTVAYTHSSIIKSVERILGLSDAVDRVEQQRLHGSVQHGVLSVRARLETPHGASLHCVRFFRAWKRGTLHRK